VINLNKIQSYLDSQKPANIGDLFAHFRFDLDSIIISAHLMQWDLTDLLEELSTRSFTENEIMTRIEDYLEHTSLFYLMVPRSVQVALILFLNFQEITLSREMVLELKDQPNYLSNLDYHNIFDGAPVIFFSSRVELREDFISIVEQSVLDLTVHFQEPEYKNFFDHFELVPFLRVDEASRQDFVSMVEHYREDILHPIIVALRAEIRGESIVYSYDNSNLAEMIKGLSSGIDFAKLKENLIRNTKEEFFEEMGENILKFAISSAWGLGALDIGIKTVKLFLLSLTESTNPLSSTQVNRDNVEFRDSGKETVREWFYDKTRSQLLEAMKESNLTDFSLTDAFLNQSYQNFITRYFKMASLTDDPSIITRSSHTAIFLAVYEKVNDLSIRTDSNKY
jgi:hypothetical protein